MNRRSAFFKPLAISVTIGALSCSLQAQAGGLYLWQIGTPTLGTAGAGWAATPEDAATSFTNPAGTVWRDGTESRAAAQMMYGDIGFTDGGESNVPGNDGGNPIEWFPGAGSFTAGKLNDKLGWGFAIAGNFGLGLHYRNEWKGRRFAQDIDFLGMSLIPSLSYKINPCLSVGVGLNVMGGYIHWKSSPRAGFADEDAFLRYKDLELGYGGNIGVIYKPVDTTTLGITYTSKIEFEFQDHLELRGFTPPLEPLANILDGRRTQIDITAPATVTASLQQQLNPATTLYSNIAWQDWSDYAGYSLSLNNPNQTSIKVDRGYKDTGHFSLGLKRQFNRGFLDGWYLSFGIGYDSSMTNTSSVTADTVTDESFTLGLGAGKKLCPGVSVDFGYNLIWMGDIDIDQRGGDLFSPKLEGTYKDTALHFFGGSIQFEL